MSKSTYVIICFFSLTLYSMLIVSKHFVLISPPGSGKGTFSQYMSKKYGYIHIGTGDIYRKRIENKESVEMSIIIQIIKEKIVTAIKNNQLFILDNAIGSYHNFQFWKSFFKMHHISDDVCFLVLQACDQTCINRIKYRLICTKCFNVCQKKVSEKLHRWNIQRCNQCGNILSTRNEDNEISVRKRFKNYYQKINPVIKELEESFQVIKISSDQPLETLYGLYDELHNNLK